MTVNSYLLLFLTVARFWVSNDLKHSSKDNFLKYLNYMFAVLYHSSHPLSHLILTHLETEAR